jgi:MOSC domain-containing protein YiiM
VGLIEPKKPRIIAVCKSATKGTRKNKGTQGYAREDFGFLGDAHADSSTHRQVSLLSIESIEKIRRLGVDVGPGDFAENLTTQGIDLLNLPIGSLLVVGNQVTLEVTQIGKECHTKCAIYRQVGKCIMPTEGVFARVQKGGIVRIGDPIRLKDVG